MVIKWVLIVLVAKSRVSVYFNLLISGAIVVVVVIVILVTSLGRISNALAIGRVQKIATVAQLAPVARVASEAALNAAVA
jgi:hypothetical protein